MSRDLNTQSPVQDNIVNLFKETLSMLINICQSWYFCGLLYEAFCKTDYIVKNSTMTGEHLIEEKLEWGGSDVIEGINRHLLGCSHEYHRHLCKDIHCTGPDSNQVHSIYFLSLLLYYLTCCHGVVKQLINPKDISPSCTELVVKFTSVSVLAVTNFRTCQEFMCDVTNVGMPPLFTA